MKTVPVLLSVLMLASGCASYSWRPAVPADHRTVQVPVFRDSSNLTETGAAVTRQILREFQREGTFDILSDGAAVEVQGEVVSAIPSDLQTNYVTGRRLHSGMLVILAKVSVIDKISGTVLIDRAYSGEAQYSAGQDNTTAYRDAANRAADILAQRVVDDVTKLDFKVKSEKK